jgi:DNA-binding NtrC family response regulator
VLRAGHHAADPLTLVQRALRVPTMEALSYAEAKQRFERNYLVQLLKLTDGNVADAARIADRNRTEFYRLLQKYELTPQSADAQGAAAESTLTSARQDLARIKVLASSGGKAT